MDRMRTIMVAGRFAKGEEGTGAAARDGDAGGEGEVDERRGEAEEGDPGKRVGGEDSFRRGDGLQIGESEEHEVVYRLYFQ